ncbi:hypothetical protein RRG08_059159 [Elysia crispata]|uniref:Uncharacterized protein n=1 Tax=Elysia crispata TaxID=231223 RepID=A0AAE1DN12_9GAST|nr:hypothetical protein RRG08_059159 [Elysia crispata]
MCFSAPSHEGTAQEVTCPNRKEAASENASHNLLYRILHVSPAKCEVLFLSDGLVGISGLQTLTFGQAHTGQGKQIWLMSARYVNTRLALVT